ncbi:DMT family transporter [Williamsia sp.]|uniref:DMT family transporter n=1 Tax=Williamsia sp. TaxID=1872085 RepID=UPI002F92E0EF
MIKMSTLLVFMWSSGYLGAELAARYSSWHMLLACRFVLAAALLVGFCVIRNRWRRSAAELEPWRLTRTGLARQVALGVVMQGMYLGAIGAAVQAGLSAGITALICSLQPLVVAAGALPILGERIGKREWGGLVVGILGVGLVVGGKLAVGDAPWWAYLLCVFGMLSLVGGTLAQRKMVAPEPVVVALAIQCTVGAVVFWALNVTLGDVIPPLTIEFGGSLLWVVALSTFGGWGAYMWVNREAGPMHVSTLLLLVPPTTMLIAWPMFGDAIGPWEIVGVVVSTVGVAVKLAGAGGTEKTPARNTEVCGPEPVERVG